MSNELKLNVLGDSDSTGYKIYPGKKIFPIKSETACLLKWSWSTVNFEMGTSSSCHRTQYWPVDPDNFDQFHNLPQKIQAREAMLDGHWPGHGCQYCANVEQVGGVSDRMMNLERHHGLDKIPPELLQDPTATSVTPIILEVYFNNTCNLSCLYCSSNYSSKINDELRKFGDIRIDNFSMESHTHVNNRYEKMVSSLWKYLEENNRYQIIRHFQVAGGEALLQRELDQSLNFWATHPNPSLVINLISNLMIPHHQFVKKMQKVEELVTKECIYMLELTASLDCWGEPQRYIRHGLDLDTWQQNFEYMLDKEWCKLTVHSCVTALSIKTMPDLIEKIKQWQSMHPDREIEHNFDIVIGQQNRDNGLHPKMFGPGVFDQDIDRIVKCMPNETEKQRTVRNQIIGHAKVIANSPRQPDKIQTLKKYLNELDRRHGTDWKQTFAWLDRDWN